MRVDRSSKRERKGWIFRERPVSNNALDVIVLICLLNFIFNDISVPYLYYPIAHGVPQTQTESLADFLPSHIMVL